MEEINFSTGEESIIVVPDIIYGNDFLRRTKILIVDNELEVVRLLERILLRVRIKSFRSATESGRALSLFEEFQPDLVLIDWLMARVNGRELIEQMHSLIPKGGFVPIVALTEHMTSETKQLALASGVNEFVVKPIEAFEAVLRITSMVQLRLAHLRLSEQKDAQAESTHQNTIDLERVLKELKANRKLLAQAQRLSALGTMASGIAHDFNNSLTLIMGTGEILLHDAERQRLTKENAVPLLQDILTAARDASTLASQLREFTRSGDTGEVHCRVNLQTVVEQAVSFTKPKWESRACDAGGVIRIEVDLQELPMIVGDAGRLREAITNLIFNAVDAMPGGGKLTLRTRAKADMVRLEVSDTGSGMTEEVRRKCSEPFFTTKGKSGTGLGLAMVFGTAQRHSGSMEIASELGKGSTFTLILPAAPDG